MKYITLFSGLIAVCCFVFINTGFAEDSESPLIFGGPGDELLFLLNDDTHALPAASSSYPDDKWGKYGAESAFDGNRETAWVEGVDGPGIYEVLVFIVPENAGIIKIFPGYWKKNVFKVNNRVKKIRFSLFYANIQKNRLLKDPLPYFIKYEIFEFQDEMKSQEFEIGSIKDIPKPEQGPYNSILGALMIESIYKGRDDDTCIAEVEFAEPHGFFNYLEGTWHGNYVISDTVSDRFIFDKNGTFSFYGRQIHPQEEMPYPYTSYFFGEWELTVNTLTLYIYEKKIDEGEGIVEYKYNPPQKEQYVLNPIIIAEYAEGYKRPEMRIGDKTYWYFDYLFP